MMLSYDFLFAFSEQFLSRFVTICDITCFTIDPYNGILCICECEPEFIVRFPQCSVCIPVFCDIGENMNCAGEISVIVYQRINLDIDPFVTDLQVCLLASPGIHHAGVWTSFYRFRRAVKKLAAALAYYFVVRLFKKSCHRLVALKYFAVILVENTDTVGDSVKCFLPLFVKAAGLPFCFGPLVKILSCFVQSQPEYYNHGHKDNN